MNFISKPVLTVDIVSFSLMTGRQQLRTVELLIHFLNQAIPESQNNPDARIWSSAGDGGALTFWNDNLAALHTAISLGQLIQEHNQNPGKDLPFQIRMGLHVGPVTRAIDFDNRENIWGEGMNMSARVANLAQPGQILASESFFHQAELDRYSSQEVSFIGRWWVKHNRSIVIYNIFINGVGIPPQEIEEWYRPFHYPLQMAVETYEAMLKEQVETHSAFRAAVIAKRLLDLSPNHTQAREVLAAISERRHGRRSGQRELYDPFFSGLSPNAIYYFFANARFITCERDTIVAEEGEDANSMMMVVSGQILPSIEGHTIRAPDPEHADEETELVFDEGNLIGEMGLFSLGGKRTASMSAIKNSIMLELNYDYLRLMDDHDYMNNQYRLEIQQQIWKSYCIRTIQNKINSYPLFEVLSSAERNRLQDDGKFLPEDRHDMIHLDANYAWNHWIIVVAGRMIVYGDQNTVVEYSTGDCLGPIRLARKDCPFSKVEVFPDTHLILFPWLIIKEFLQKNSEFYEACSISSIKDNERFDDII